MMYTVCFLVLNIQTLRRSVCGLLYTNSIPILCGTVVTEATPYHKHDHLLTRFVLEPSLIFLLCILFPMIRNFPDKLVQTALN